ncbi:hypothetical protein BDQ12DRAFT_675206 [Crucibulum laeve]|uniref:RING-type domain-containing protein n=1 Tax=Crucibulum laeve TaxID=68775 RepID=A0A5C3MDS2_9AGAR|nr:hypothetical protein BDQ12DRAFT_675206 [Crucibulum laeve]
MDPAAALVIDAILSTADRICLAIEHLPVLSKDQVRLDDSCPICLMPLESLFIPPDDETDDAGVTKLPGCGHVFCRKDLSEWIRSQHGSCPTCRHVFLNIRPPSDSDDESSDGGEYIPPEDLEEDEEDFIIEIDGFSEADGADFDVDEMEIDMDDVWGEHDFDAGEDGDAEMDDEDEDDELEWGLTDGESESMSSVGDTSAEREGTSPQRGYGSWMVRVMLIALLLFSTGNGG